jgi:hypothetical protein
MPLRRLLVASLGVVLVPLAAYSQVYSTPTPRPQASAASREWFQDGRPILFAGDLYYPGGARYHFDAEVMVETGSYDGVPLYADTTATPYDEVLVPIGGGLVQPYQRRRVGGLAGTTGSHPPDYPVDIVPWENGSAQAPRGVAVPFQPAPADVDEREARASQADRAWQQDEEARQRLLQPPGRIQTILEPQDNRGIWITYEGQRWNAAGQAVASNASQFSRIGEYHGFPVFSTAGREEIFIPAAEGMLAAYVKDGK